MRYNVMNRKNITNVNNIIGLPDIRRPRSVR